MSSSVSRRPRRDEPGQGSNAFAVSRAVPRRGKLRGLFVEASLVQRLCLPRLWRATVGGAQESRLYLRVPRLWSANVSHFGNGDASFQAATDGMVLGFASHVDSFERDVGASVGRPTRRHI